MNNNNNKFLKIYALIILMLLAVIFMVPDKVYLDLINKLNNPKISQVNNKDEKESEKEYIFTDINIQKENLLTKDHEYEYTMLDSIGTKTITATCTGQVEKGEDTGTCSSQEKVAYTKETKKETIIKTGVKYIDLEYIFNSIKDIEPTELSYTKSRELTYKTKILKLDTDITINTDLNNITQITISNAYMTYVFKYTNIKD